MYSYVIINSMKYPILDHLILLKWPTPTHNSTICHWEISPSKSLLKMSTEALQIRVLFSFLIMIRVRTWNVIYLKYIYQFWTLFLLFLVRGLQPRSFTKIAYSKKLFEVSWIPPFNAHEVTSYTIFWCKSQDNRDRPYQVTEKF